MAMGTIIPMTERRVRQPKPFWSYVAKSRKPDGCWEWIGGKDARAITDLVTNPPKKGEGK